MGEVYIVNGVKFDGLVEGVLVDAKGPGYASFVKDGRFRSWFDGADDLVDQAERQLRVAEGAPITWHVAEEEVVPAIRALLTESGYGSINVIHTPPINP
jgi:hypothetical protein